MSALKNYSARLSVVRSAASVCGLLLGAPAIGFSHGAMSERIALLDLQIAAQPTDAALRVKLAEVRCEHDEWRAALGELDEADRLAPGKFPTDLVRGEAFLLGRQPGDARAALDRFIAAHPPHPKAFTLRARAHDALKNSAASLADYDAAWRATAQPEPDLVQEFSNALARAGRHEDALRILEAGIGKVGAVPGLVLLALEREVATGRIDAALIRIAALQKSAPRPEPWMAKRASLLAQAGRRVEARAAWQALSDHLAALPNLERGSHAMSLLAEQARTALTDLQTVYDLNTVPAPESKS